MSTDEMQRQFPTGSLVYTRSAPHGQPGIVQGHSRGRVEVRFPSLGYAGRFRVENLILESEVDR
jgi:hypothetical protein